VLLLHIKGACLNRLEKNIRVCEETSRADFSCRTAWEQKKSKKTSRTKIRTNANLLLSIKRVTQINKGKKQLLLTVKLQSLQVID